MTVHSILWMESKNKRYLYHILKRCFLKENQIDFILFYKTHPLLHKDLVGKRQISIVKYHKLTLISKNKLNKEIFFILLKVITRYLNLSNKKMTYKFLKETNFKDRLQLNLPHVLTLQTKILRNKFLFHKIKRHSR